MKEKVNAIVTFFIPPICSGGDGGSTGGASGGGVYIETDVAKIGGMYREQ